MKVTFKGEEVEIVACSNRTTTIQFIYDGYLSEVGEWVYRQLVLSNKHHTGFLFLGKVCIL